MSREPVTFPAEDWEGWLHQWSRERLAAAADAAASLKEAPLGDPAILDRWNDVRIALANVLGVCELLSEVHPDAAVLDLAEAIGGEARERSTDLLLDGQVHDLLTSVSASDLDTPAARVRTLALLDFRRAGVDRDPDVRAQVRDLDQRLTRLQQVYMRNIRDGRRTTPVPAVSLDGLPDDYVAEHPADDRGMVAISTERTDTDTFLRFSADAESRRAVAHSFYNLGYPANVEVFGELVAARHEKASLLGYDGWPDYDAELKMTGTGSAIAAFIDQVAEETRSSAERDRGVLTARARDGGEHEVDLANWLRWFEVVKREDYGVDMQEVRRYFDFQKVRDGLLELTGHLFGLTYTVVDAPSWHGDVTTYDVRQDDGELLGRIRLDLHPRQGKGNGAAQFDLVKGVRDRQLAEGALMCNFPRGLMTHGQVVTFFHEFGHLVHQLSASQDAWVRFSGTSSEQDFLEAPSQMFEEWAWDPAVLQRFATDAEGRAIPTDLIDRMRRAEEFGKGLLARSQVFYAALSYRLHAERPEDLTQRMVELYDEYSPVRALPDTHFFCLFHHLVNYSSGYYTYLWSLVIAKDMFSVFDPDDLLATEVARRYRDTVLVPGASKDARDLVADFLGRPYDTAAFTEWLDQSPGGSAIVPAP